MIIENILLSLFESSFKDKVIIYGFFNHLVHII